MPRITLRTKHPTRVLPNGNPDYLPLDEPPPKPPVINGISPILADQLFMARDDLILLFPDDRTLLSQPSFGTPARKRQYRGELSWMATVVPLNVNVGNQANRQYDDEYLLSIIVFSARNLALERANSVDADIADVPERTTNVRLLGGGFSGGEVQLRHPIHKNVTNRLQYAENVLKVQTNSWIMLSGNVANNNANQRKRYYRWYRVLNASPAVVNQNGVATRNVTLQGADWELANNNTQATIMEGVVGVFERKIRLDHSSLW